MDKNRVTRLMEGKVEKGAVEHRGTFKPKAPDNLVLPKPVRVPTPPTQNNQTAPKK